MIIKRSKLSISTFGFSNLMLIVIAAVAVGAVRFSMTMGESRTLPRDFDQIDAVIETSRQDVQRYTELEKLPKLVSSWKKVTASFELDGLKFETFDANNSSEMGNTYSGPLKGWPGQVIGDPQVVISSVRSLQKEIPLYLYDYSIANGVMKLNFVVVGT
ncbi:hypothetical protein P7I93_34620 (plasmid) [Pseudomonas aeruginosa]|uniref:hypothetical protein n=1 Tax=Pseudomonas aeruginosa TaxID=287 RepID=UPI001B323026|nr:hypothetical protein [Pseudomonas aeruginosa]EIW4148859.1 hypothetical protein [Pseudomonas aeruginosa]EKU5855247.1 hypothetical protein [Pseudomonas aeruginosa]EKV8090252.1 hypothetical protein [Pseudomonas aeruginosa]EKW6387783.1 hypothetical protein [Pseudomonas aeruginosa]EKW6419018.1 hypothetical protein [Pseudomonas aeruginosa]